MSSPATRHKNYYFQSGNVVLKIQDTLFRVHRDVVGRHSKLLEELFTNFSPNDKEGQSDETPLVVAAHISTAEAFSTICEFLYPTTLGVFPDISVDNLDRWEPVWDATFELGIPSIQKLISQKIRANKAKMTRVVPRLLRLARRLGEEELERDCYFYLIYRAHPMTPDECTALGLEPLIVLMTVREKTRNLLAWHLEHTSVDKNEHCAGKSSVISELPSPVACQQAVVSAIREQMKTPAPERSFGTVFDVDKHEGMCSSCVAARGRLALSCRKTLDPKVRQWLLEFRPPPEKNNAVAKQSAGAADTSSSD